MARGEFHMDFWPASQVVSNGSFFSYSLPKWSNIQKIWTWLAPLTTAEKTGKFEKIIK
jgi:hypothetical protein